MKVTSDDDKYEYYSCFLDTHVGKRQGWSHVFNKHFNVLDIDMDMTEGQIIISMFRYI